MVATALPEAFIVAGLTVHTGLETVPPTDGVTVQPNVIGPTNPEPVTIEMSADETPPGATAFGFKFGLTVIVKSVCAEAVVAVKTAAAITHKAATRPHADQDFNLDSHHLDLNMSRFRFLYPSIPGIAKKLPAQTHASLDFVFLRGIQAAKQA